MILVKDYITTGFSADDAGKLNEIIKPLFDKREKIILNFIDVKNFTTLFFNNALSKYLVEIGPDDYNGLFETNNLSKVGEVTYQHSLENAKHYYRMNLEQRKNQDDILLDID